jgi:hypothetical protein
MSPVLVGSIPYIFYSHQTATVSPRFHNLPIEFLDVAIQSGLEVISPPVELVGFGLKEGRIALRNEFQDGVLALRVREVSASLMGRRVNVWHSCAGIISKRRKLLTEFPLQLVKRGIDLFWSAAALVDIDNTLFKVHS